MQEYLSFCINNEAIDYNSKKTINNKIKVPKFLPQFTVLDNE